MKNILIISFFFPPMGGAGTQRMLKLVKYLPSMGIKPYIVTCTENTYGPKDNSLLNDIPEQAEIIRVPSFYLKNHYHRFRFLKLNQILSFIDKNFIWPDSTKYWSRKIVSVCRDIIKKNNIKNIITTGGPFSVHIAGLKIKEKLPWVNWIADFRDEWTSNPMRRGIQYPWFRKLYEKKYEKRICLNSDFITVISRTMKKNIILNNGIDRDKVFVIYNGYDEEDFTFPDNSGKNKKIEYYEKDRDTGTFNISYSGTLYSQRHPNTFFKAVSLLLIEKPEYREEIRINFYGYKGILVKKGIRKYKLGSIVMIHGSVPHERILEKIGKSDLLLLIIGKFKGAESVLTGKIFEYLKLHIPILGLGPEYGEAADILKATGAGIMIEFDDINRIKCAIDHLVTCFLEGLKPEFVDYHDEVINQFNRKKAVENFFSLLK